MKSTNKFLAFALVSVAMGLASCSSDILHVGPTQEQIEEKLIGKWKIKLYANEECETNEKKVLTFYNDGKMTYSKSDIKAKDGNAWYQKVEGRYSIDDKRLTLSMPGQPSSSEINMTVNLIDDVRLITTLENSNGTTGRVDENYDRVNISYSQDNLLGMWECVYMDGWQTYDKTKGCIEYIADGTYNYFEQYAGMWFPSMNVGNVYNVDGNWLGMRWRPEQGADYNCEFWDIEEMNNGSMKWSSLRYDEQRKEHNQAYTWNKVERPSAEQYKSMILGEWRTLQSDTYEVKNGEVVDMTEKTYEGKMIYTFNADNTFSQIYYNPDGSLYLEYYGRYEMHGSVVAITIEKIVIMGTPYDMGEPSIENLAIYEIDNENLSLVENVNYFEANDAESEQMLLHMKMKKQ